MNLKRSNCGFKACDRLAVAKGYCDKHYRRILKHGTLEASRHVAEGNEIERFHQKYEQIPIAGCWVWMGGTRPNARGLVYGRHHLDNGTCTGAHRFSWALHFGEIPNGMFVCHHCDNPRCVNPNHLFIGTSSDNMQDMVRKGRHNKARGEKKIGRSKLTNEQAKEIRANKTLSNAKIAHQYQVSAATISRVRNHVSY